MDLLDLMRPSPKPRWRDGEPVAAGPSEEGDLQWLADVWDDHRKGGKWFRYDARDSIWRCLDPFHQAGINKFPDQPPMLDLHGRLPSEVAA
jgi:hypothetical protein